MARTSLPAKRRPGLTRLGRPTVLPASPAAAVLETVPNPHPGTLSLVRVTAPAFTALCPITGQPDVAPLAIDDVPKARLVESKSLKLFPGAVRNHGGAHRG
jgi:7-cyano-7-deazaguanine reductase